MEKAKASIVIAHRGWIWAGMLKREENQMVIRKAMNIRRWGTTQGLGQLRDGPLAETTLDPTGVVRLHPLQIIATIDIDEKGWSDKLDTEVTPNSENMNTRIVIAHRGWVWAGIYTQEKDQMVISRAVNIRRWGTNQGLGQLRNGPLTETTLDPTGVVRLHPLQVIATIDVDAKKWEDRLMPEEKK